MSTRREPLTTRLNTTQFLVLRSIARESWDWKRGRIQWRFNGKWFYIYRRYGICYGVRTRIDGDIGWGWGCYEDVIEQAWAAAWELEELGLVEIFTTRCCPGTECHTNDRPEFRLTPRGIALLHAANVTSQRNKLANQSVQAVPSLVAPVNIRLKWWEKVISKVRNLMREGCLTFQKAMAKFYGSLAE